MDWRLGVLRRKRRVGKKFCGECCHLPTHHHSQQEMKSVLALLCLCVAVHAAQSESSFQYSPPTRATVLGVLCPSYGECAVGLVNAQSHAKQTLASATPPRKFGVLTNVTGLNAVGTVAVDRVDVARCRARRRRSGRSGQRHALVSFFQCGGPQRWLSNLSF